MGIFYRTTRLLENGIKPAYIFDGKPPSLKSDELKKRGEARGKAVEAQAKAVEEGNVEQENKFSRRTVKALPEHNTECQRLLKLMGIPYHIVCHAR
jgi:flap endonuclease-1